MSIVESIQNPHLVRRPTSATLGTRQGDRISDSSLTQEAAFKNQHSVSSGRTASDFTFTLHMETLFICGGRRFRLYTMWGASPERSYSMKVAISTSTSIGDFLGGEMTSGAIRYNARAIRRSHTHLPCP